jgi:hypothetical protein
MRAGGPDTEGKCEGDSRWWLQGTKAFNRPWRKGGLSAGPLCGRAEGGPFELAWVDSGLAHTCGGLFVWVPRRGVRALRVTVMRFTRAILLLFGPVPPCFCQNPKEKAALPRRTAAVVALQKSLKHHGGNTERRLEHPTVTIVPRNQTSSNTKARRRCESHDRATFEHRAR